MKWEIFLISVAHFIRGQMAAASMAEFCEQSSGNLGWKLIRMVTYSLGRYLM